MRILLRRFLDIFRHVDEAEMSRRRDAAERHFY